MIIDSNYLIRSELTVVAKQVPRSKRYRCSVASDVDEYLSIEFKMYIFMPFD